jgi:hypothetical protein
MQELYLSATFSLPASLVFLPIAPGDSKCASLYLPSSMIFYLLSPELILPSTLLALMTQSSLTPVLYAGLNAYHLSGSAAPQQNLPAFVLMSRRFCFVSEPVPQSFLTFPLWSAHSQTGINYSPSTFCASALRHTPVMSVELTALLLATATCPHCADDLSISGTNVPSPLVFGCTMFTTFPIVSSITLCSFHTSQHNGSPVGCSA